VAAERFETLLRALSATPTRRSAVRVLAGSAFGGVLTPGAQVIDAQSKGRRGASKGKRKKCRCARPPTTPPPCPAEPPAVTCAGGACGPRTNNCGQTISCGCTDPAVPECCGGFCHGLCGAAEFRNRGSCQCVPCRQETAIGTVCANNVECCSNVCAPLGGPDQPRICRIVDCRDVGQSCGANIECCDGFCAVPPGAGTLKCVAG
jgi:hypothetical protein